MKKLIGLTVLVAAVLSSKVYAIAFECPNGKFVKKGSSSSELILKCGSPDLREVINDGSNGTKIEIFTYRPANKGGFYKHLTIKNGQFIRVKSGSRAK
jgi:hypothetical protein